MRILVDKLASSKYPVLLIRAAFHSPSIHFSITINQWGWIVQGMMFPGVKWEVAVYTDVLSYDQLKHIVPAGIDPAGMDKEDYDKFADAILELGPFLTEPVRMPFIKVEMSEPV